MKSKISLLTICLVLIVTSSSNFSQAEEAKMTGVFFDGGYEREDSIVRTNNPIRTHISITNTPQNIQELHQVNLLVIYENPVASGETGYFNTRLSYRDVGLFNKGQIIGRGNRLPTEQKPRPPIGDADFIKMKPGERRSTDWLINLNEREMLEGTHQYELIVVGNHTLPSVVDKVLKETQYKKLALTVDTQSNTVTFTYTKPPKD